MSSGPDRLTCINLSSAKVLFVYLILTLVNRDGEEQHGTGINPGTVVVGG